VCRRWPGHGDDPGTPELTRNRRRPAPVEGAVADGQTRTTHFVLAVVGTIVMCPVCLYMVAVGLLAGMLPHDGGTVLVILVGGTPVVSTSALFLTWLPGPRNRRRSTTAALRDAPARALSGAVPAQPVPYQPRGWAPWAGLACLTVLWAFAEQLSGGLV